MASVEMEGGKEGDKLTNVSLLVEIINWDQGSGRFGLCCSALLELIISK